MKNKIITLNDLISRGKETMRDNYFFNYDAFKNNCQTFIKNLLIGVDLYNQDIDDFLCQDLTQIHQEMPSISLEIIKFYTKARLIFPFL